MKFSEYIVNEELSDSFQKTYDTLQEWSKEIVPVDIELNEEQKQQILNEEVLTVTFIIGMLLGAPTIITMLAKSFGFIYKSIKRLFGKNDTGTPEAVEKLVGLMDKWHHSYIKIIRQVLRFSGVFKSAGITDKEKQMKAAEVVFYTIILGFAISGGLATGKSIISMARSAHLSHVDVTVMEAVLTAVKSNEVKSFINKMSTSVA